MCDYNLPSSDTFSSLKKKKIHKLQICNFFLILKILNTFSYDIIAMSQDLALHTA